MLPIPPSTQTHILFLFFASAFLLCCAAHTAASTSFYLFDLLAEPIDRVDVSTTTLNSIGCLHTLSTRILDVQHRFAPVHTSRTLLNTCSGQIRDPISCSKLGVSSSTSFFLLCYCRHHLSWSASLLLHIQHVPTACFDTLLLLPSSPSPPNKRQQIVSHLILTNSVLSLVRSLVGSFALALSLSSSLYSTHYPRYNSCRQPAML